MTTPTREAFEAAARRHFAYLNAELDRPREFHPVFGDEDMAITIDVGRARVADLEDQLRRNIFDGPVQIAAARLATMIGVEFADCTERQQVVAGQLAARAEREQQRRLIHQLLRPGEPFAGDPLFAAPVQSAAVSVSRVYPHTQPQQQAAPSDESILSAASATYLARKKAKGVGSSQITELTRALDWLAEEVGADRPLGSITKNELRQFRTDIERLDVTLRGRDAPFKARLTNVRANQIKSATSVRYWKSIQALFSWAVDEGFIDNSPAAGLKIEPRKDDLKKTPPPFTPAEVKRLFETPLYAGHKSPKRMLEAGNDHGRRGQWWSGLLALFTGMRAGEISQLEPADFHFDAEVPFVRFNEMTEDGKKTKQAKNKASNRDQPISPVLLELGLREFVQGRAKLHPGKRLFFELRLGSNGRSSEGMTAFWGRYLRKFGLWAEGRSTHMFRHTVADRLRANGVSDEDIGALLGHGGTTITSKYGGGQPLTRKAATLAKLDYGFDVVAALGGPYDKKKHR